MWIVHILACGWYLCAALHEVPADTWVMRRVLDAEGATVVDREPFDQWLNAMYFVLTVFTTVGFGDMFAVTNGEIVYVCITMGVGAVVHSIIISEVINVVTSSDQMNVFVMKQRELIEALRGGAMESVPGSSTEGGAVGSSNALLPNKSMMYSITRIFCVRTFGRLGGRVENSLALLS